MREGGYKAPGVHSLRDIAGLVFDSEGKGRKRSSSFSRGRDCERSLRDERREGEWVNETIRRSRKGVLYIMESLILAQNERWRRVLSMQVGR